MKILPFLFIAIGLYILIGIILIIKDFNQQDICKRPPYVDIGWQGPWDMIFTVFHRPLIPVIVLFWDSERMLRYWFRKR